MNLAEVLDAAILIWLIGTWFYEGHHRRCSVKTTCPDCGKESEITCSAAHKDP